VKEFSLTAGTNMNNYPLVSIIVLDINGRTNLGPLLDKCLTSLVKTRYPNFVTYFVENGGTDDTIEYISKQFYAKLPNFRIIKFNHNHGYAMGNNLAFELIDPTTKYVVFINNDVIVDHNWLEKLVLFAEKNEDFGALCPKIKELNQPELLQCVGARMMPLGYEVVLGHCQKDVGQYDNLPFILSSSVSGACFFIRYDLFKKISKFDEDYYLYYEDIDLSWRIWLYNFKIAYIPLSVIYHAKSLTSKSIHTYAFITFYQERNRLLTLIKNYSLTYLLKYLPGTFFIQFLLFCKLISMGQNLQALYILKAISWILKNLNKVLIKRKSVQLFIRKVSDKYIEKMIMAPISLSYLKYKFSKLYYIK
jgi:GT2 family glycosyltransferase